MPSEVNMFTSLDMTRSFGIRSKPAPLLIQYSSIYLFLGTLNLEGKISFVSASVDVKYNYKFHRVARSLFTKKCRGYQAFILSRLVSWTGFFMHLLQFEIYWVILCYKPTCYNHLFYVGQSSSFSRIFFKRCRLGWGSFFYPREEFDTTPLRPNNCFTDSGSK